jgi:hypothetical protein
VGRSLCRKFKVVDESYADGFPPRLQSLITTIDELAQDESAKLKLLVEKVFKIYDEERPHTLVHGDCNAGNTWKPLAGMGQTGFLFAGKCSQSVCRAWTAAVPHRVAPFATTVRRRLAALHDRHSCVGFLDGKRMSELCVVLFPSCVALLIADIARWS